MPKVTTHQRQRLVKRVVWPFPVSNGQPTQAELAPALPKPVSVPKHQAPPGEEAPL